MTYDCQLYNGSFVVAKLSPAEWSPQDQSPPFQIVPNVEACEAEEDYQVEIIPSVTVWASQISPNLINTDEINV